MARNAIREEFTMKVHIVAYSIGPDVRSGEMEPAIYDALLKAENQANQTATSHSGDNKTVVRLHFQDIKKVKQ